jgi:hypothetical protein
MDILGMLVREDRVKAVLEKKKIEYTEEEKNKEKGGPITFGDSDDEFLDLMLSEDEEDEEDEKDYENDKIISLPTIDFIYTPPTFEERVQQRLDSLAKSLYHMKELPFVNLCIKEGVLSENHIY